MAKATFSCADCGASVKVYGPNRRTVDYIAERREAEGALCDDCQAKERAAANQAAAERNAAAGLPPLTGSDKQIAWAETIRESKLGKIADAQAGRLEPGLLLAHWGESDITDPVIDIALPILRAQDRASWWIDHRDKKAGAIIQEIARDMAAPPPAAPIDADLAAAVLAEATARPENEITATVAEITATSRTITIRFPEKRDDFRQLVRFELGYTWQSPHWVRAITDRSGPIEDRLIEAGHRLLQAGFAIRIHDETLRARAIAGDYRHERTHWVARLIAGEHKDWLLITWPREADLYATAKRLPGARYERPGIAVPPDAFDALDDFIDAHGFAVTASARAAIDVARAAHTAALIATPGAGPAPAEQAPGTMPAATGDIDPDLRDD